MDYLCRGAIIGILFGLPVGVVGAMTVQRAWGFGFRAGLLTGFGSSVADCFYAVVGAFGLTVISDFLMAHQTAITIAGGALVLYIGICLFFKKESTIQQNESLEKIGNIRLFLSSFAVGMTNPAAILTFLFAFTYFGISNIARPVDGVFLVAGILVGTCLWWISLSLATCVANKKVGKRKAFRTNQLFGSILVMFAMGIFLRLLQ